MRGVKSGGNGDDATAPIEIDRSNPPERYRYVCPNGHANWDRTNNHIWCQTCRRQNEHGAAVDPEHYELVDKRTGETIDWQRVELVGE